jgi:phosphatidylglycerol:prolipoprotein diacylglycerol transferase
MYPRLLEIPLGGDTAITIYAYGFMVAVAILVGSWIIGIELNRLQSEGRFGQIRVGVGSKADKSKRGKKGTVVLPSDLIGTMTIIAAVVGVAGSKLFHILENLDQFLMGPLDMIFSTGGLTFYGGLISAGLAIAWYGHSKGIHVPTLADAFAPSLILGYGIGRIGCHLAGDGDWGIVSDLASKPGFIPGWLWAETYPNNILGVALPSPGVYPTSIYEFLATLALFGLLWSLRKHAFRPGWLFMVYLFVNGLERLLIEQIRVNNTFDLAGLEVTQAEVIATMLMVIGLIGSVWLAVGLKIGAKPRAKPAGVGS